MNTAQRIQTMISNTMCTDDILLVLISGKVLFTKKPIYYLYLFVYKRVFIDQTLDLDFLNNRQNVVGDVHLYNNSAKYSSSLFASDRISFRRITECSGNAVTGRLRTNIPKFDPRKRGIDVRA